MQVGIVGLGLIGGSLGLGLQKNGFADKVIGIDANKEHANLALELGLVNEILSLVNAINVCDVFLLAIPVNGISKLLPELLDKITDKQIVIDLGSTKGKICSIVESHKNRASFIAAHPIAGTENSGPKAAIGDLFFYKKCIICNSQQSSKTAVSLAKKIFQSLFMELVFMDAEEHDLHIAYVSHLSHVSSFALSLTALSMETDEKNIFNMAGSGFDSTVRLAKSSPEMWTPIFEQNAKFLSKSIASYIEQLTLLKQYIDTNQLHKVNNMLTEANKIREVLN